MRTVLPIIFVLIGLYGATIAVKPHLAVPRNRVLSTSALTIARVKGIAAMAMAGLLLWRLFG